MLETTQQQMKTRFTIPGNHKCNKTNINNSSSGNYTCHQYINDWPTNRPTHICMHAFSYPSTRTKQHSYSQNSHTKKIIYGVHKQQQQQPQQQQRQSKQKQQPRKTAQKNNALLHNSSGYIFLFWMRICSVLSSQTITHRFECGEQGERGERTEKRRRRRREKKTAQEQHSMMHFIVANTVRSRIESFRFA